MRIDKVTRQFAPLGEVKLNPEDKKEILQHLREEMERADVSTRPNKPQLQSRRRHRALRTYTAIAASVAIVALGAATVDRWLKAPSGHNVGPGIVTIYAYTRIAPPHFNVLQMTGPTSGWGYGYDDQGRFHLIRTVNGIGWSQVTLPSHPPVYDISSQQLGMPGYVRADFADASHAWLAWIEGDRLHILRTTNGGSTWQSSQTAMPLYAETVANVDFVNANRGWLLAVSQAGMGGEHKALFETNNGGQTWTKVADDAGGLPHAGTTTGLTLDADGLTGWLTSGSPVSTGNILYRTLDGGHTWQSISLPVPTALQGSNPVSVTAPIFDGKRGTLSAMFTANNVNVPVIYRTSDGGNHWTAVMVSGQGYGLPDFVTVDVGFVLRRYPGLTNVRVLETDDGGHEWKARSTLPLSIIKAYPNVANLTFVSREVGWMLLQTSDYRRSTWMRSTDGGRTWMVP